MADIPKYPVTRRENFLSAAAGRNVKLPSNSLTREERYLREIANQNSNNYTFENIAKIISDGDAKRLLNIGDLIYVNRTISNGKAQEYPWEIVDIADNEITLQMYRVFDERNMGTEALYYAENGLKAGYYSIDMPPVGKACIVPGFPETIYFKLNKDIPAGGHIVANVKKGTWTSIDTYTDSMSSLGHYVYYDPDGNEVANKDIPWITSEIYNGEVIEETLPEGYTTKLVGRSFIENVSLKLPSMTKLADKTIYYDPAGNEVAYKDIPWEQESVAEDGIEDIIEHLPEGYTSKVVAGGYKMGGNPFGTSVETISLGKADGTVKNLNHISLALNGMNNYKNSYIRAWLNSDKAKGEWQWQLDNVFSRTPAAEDGFLYGWEDGFMRFIKSTAIQTLDIDSLKVLDDLSVDIETYTTEDKAFLPSLENVGGGLPKGWEGLEGTAFDITKVFPKIKLNTKIPPEAVSQLVRTPDVYENSIIHAGIGNRIERSYLPCGIAPCVVVRGKDK